MKNQIKRLACLMLAVLLCTLCACSGEISEKETTSAVAASATDALKAEPVYYTEHAESVKKAETVYINADNAGGILKTTVSDWLHTDRGEVAVLDKSGLTDIFNVKGDIAPVAENGGLTWHMDSTDLYYRGESDKPLPISIAVEYYLDGKKLDAAELAGKSGDVEIRISLTNNIVTERKIGEETVRVASPMLVVGGMILPEAGFSGAAVTNGILIGDGTKEIAVMVGMPGINETLGLDALDVEGLSFPDSFTVTAKAESFSLGNMYFAAIPLSSLGTQLELPDTFDDLKSTLEKLGEIQSSVSLIDPDMLLSSLLTGEGIESLATLVSSAMSLYRDNKALLEILPKYMTEENLAAFSSLIENLDGNEIEEFIEIMSNPVVSKVLGLAPELAADMEEIAPVMREFAADMENPEVKAALDRLPQTIEQISALRTALDENKELIDTLSELFTEENLELITGAFTSDTDEQIEAALAKYGVLADNAGPLIARLSAMIEFGGEYRIYSDAPEDFQTSVMFIWKLPPIA